MRSYSDFSDELNFKWTSGFLLLFVSAIGVLRYVFLTSLISCWTPSQFEPNHVYYTHKVCWSREAVYFEHDLDEPIPYESRPSIKPIHTKIPVMLVLMLLGFQVPRLFKLLSDICLGLPSSSVRETGGMEVSQGKINRLAEIVRESMNQCSCVKTVFFFITKLLICLNLLVQFVVVSTYIKNPFKGSANSTQGLPVFPSSFLCDFGMRQLQMVHRYTVACHMPVNALYESFFYIWWFWILGVGIFSGLTVLIQFSTLLLPPLIKIRFRGIIPDHYLALRGCTIGDDLLVLSDIQTSYGLAVARDVAIKVWEPRSKHIDSGQANYIPSHESETLIMQEKL